MKIPHAKKKLKKYILFKHKKLNRKLRKKPKKTYEEVYWTVQKALVPCWPRR